ncbi:hypothetical protein, partial [Rugamonas rubra]|uniref:hypothetical protein n=1 Tax=Rugamonas rubra TaxID=758825 RepID=UPI001C2DBC6D
AVLRAPFCGEANYSKATVYLQELFPVLAPSLLLQLRNNSGALQPALLCSHSAQVLHYGALVQLQEGRA